MKTKLQIIGIALAGFILTSCSSSMHMSKSSVASTDDIYYTPSKVTSTAPLNNHQGENTSIDNSQNISTSKYAQLEKEYASKNNSDTLTIKSDTLAANFEDINPYERILSDSYEDSYQRRQKGRENPWYGMENSSVYYSDDYWYATAFDPDLYNIIIMGDQVWVEPNYITAMFGWPHTNFSVSVGSGYPSWGWNAMYSSFNHNYGAYYYYSPFFYNFSWNCNPYNFQYYPFPSDYWRNMGWGYNPYPHGYWNKKHFPGYEHYGRRTGSITSITSPNRLTGISYENQITSSRERNRTTTISGIGRNSNNRTSTTIRDGQGTRNQEVISRGNRNVDLNSTRLRDEATTRNINMTESTRRNNNNFQRPRSTNNTDYIKTGTRNQNINTNKTSRDNSTRSTTTVRDNRGATNTYNKPSRVNTATTRERSTSSGSSVKETASTRSSDRSSSGSSSSSNSQGTRS